MPTARARTTTHGTPTISGLGDFTFNPFYTKEPCEFYQEPYINISIMDLRSLRPGKATTKIAEFLATKKADQRDRVYYYHSRATHYFKYKNVAYKYFRGNIEEI